jgi:hypothetical protein
MPINRDFREHRGCFLGYRSCSEEGEGPPTPPQDSNEEGEREFQAIGALK